MGQKIKVGIFDDDERSVRGLELALKADSDIIILCKGYSGSQAVDMILEYLPDVVLLDVVMPGMDGLEVLKQFSRLGTRVRTKFIIVSAVGAENIIAEAFAGGASYYFKKPYDSHLLIQRIRQCAGVSEALPMSGSDIRNIMEGRVENRLEDLMEREPAACVDRILRQIGFSANLRGYQYLRDAILICVENRNVLNSITKILYPTVGKMNQTTGSKVERSIRHAIASTWNRGGCEVVMKMFSYNGSKTMSRPTNGVFIAMISDRVRTEIKLRSQS